MKCSYVWLAIAGLSCLGAARAQAPGNMAAEAKQAYNSVKNNILNSAEKMPEENYDFKPSPGIRSFAEVLDHVAVAQMHTCAAVLGEQKSSDATGKTSKAEIIAALKDAFAECDKAYDSLTDANASETVQTGRGQRTKIGALTGNTSHDNEQYGMMTVYMRLKGVLPSSAAPRR